MKVLVTGAAGFIGSHVVDALCGRGAEVIGLDSLDPGVHRSIPEYLNPKAEYCFADLRAWRADERLSDVDGIIHLAALGGVTRAAREPVNILEANCLGTARLAEAAKEMLKVRTIVLGSSFSVYGSNYRYVCPSCGKESDGSRDPARLESGSYEVLCSRCGTESQVEAITEAASPSPLETYGASKYMQELCFRGFRNCRVGILRFSSVYGKRLRLDDGEATIIARLAGWIRSGQQPKLFEDGRQIRDWVYVEDVVEGLLATLASERPAAVVNVCTGVPIRLIEACGHIAKAMGLRCSPEITGEHRPGDMRHCLGNPSKFEELIGRKPLTLREGARLAFGGKTNETEMVTAQRAGSSSLRSA
ncbi:MAG: NAD-dependent epimerase/dehydratase family protein [Candidatus Acidiferrales bacterium]